jgi:mono/diheme cytochrome c family protein
VHVRKILRIIAYIGIGIVVLFVLFVAAIYLLSSRRMNRVYDVKVQALDVPHTAEVVERGRHVAELHMCTECHGADLGGTMFEDSAMFGRLPAPNLTRGRGGAAARYRAEDWVRAVLHGVAPDGRPLVFMPSHELRHMDARDLAAFVAYVNQAPPVDREWPAPSLGPVGRALMVFGSGPVLLPAELIDHDAPHRVSAPPAAPTPVYGEYLARSTGCVGCHRADLSGGSGPPPGSSNLTPAGAVKGWTEAHFIAALRTGKRPNGTTIDPAMPRGYARMTDVELQALWRYLQTVPPRQTAQK